MGLVYPELVGDPLMFAPYCETHRSNVLLPASAIKALVSTDEGILAHFECFCGTTGVWTSGQAVRRPRGTTALDRSGTSDGES